jgi:hypothetical protein
MFGNLFADRKGVAVSDHGRGRKTLLEFLVSFPGIEIPRVEDPLAPFKSPPEIVGDFGVSGGNMGIGDDADLEAHTPCGFS